ncbi:MAG: YggS family pyridoxal phosphate-dependent enzyme [Thermoleophilia bacterium]
MPGREGFAGLTSELVRMNLRAARRRVEEASGRAGRGNEVRILAATKYVSPSDMAVLREAGVRLVGENRAQDLEEKWRLYGSDFEFHFIGHLQRNKVRKVLPLVSLVHSVDSLRLLQEIAARAEAPARVLVEVNVAGEARKYGILPGEAEGFLERAAAYEEVDIAGFMTMAPLVEDPEEVRPVFRRLRELRDRLAPLFSPRFDLTELSMGTSRDYEVAVEEGATIVRLGSTLFGRN